MVKGFFISPPSNHLFLSLFNNVKPVGKRQKKTGLELDHEDIDGKLNE